MTQPSFLCCVITQRTPKSPTDEVWQWVNADTAEQARQKIVDDLNQLGYERVEVYFQMDMFRQEVNTNE